MILFENENIIYVDMMDDENGFVEFLRTHELQLIVSNIPKHFHRRMYEKMKNEIFDSGSYFQMCPVDDDDDELEEPFNPERRYYVSTLKDVILDPEKDENAIFLIDHAWTYRIKDARNNLLTIPNLYERLMALMNLDNQVKENGIETILQRMWKFNQTYTMTSTQIDPQKDCEEAYEPFWYVMDELGSSIRHSSQNANVCCTSFFFGPTQTMFSVFYPIVRIEQPFSEIFRNYIYATNDDESVLSKIKLLLWQSVHNRKTFLRNLAIDHCSEILNKKLEDNIEIFKKCHKKDLYDETVSPSMPIDKNRILKVYTDHDLVRQYLTDEHFQLIDNVNECDIMFVMKQIENFKSEILGKMMINQFPFENIVTNKELLALVARRWRSLHGSSSSGEDLCVDAQGSPPWLATTFNLMYEMPQFAVYFQYREDEHLDNTWIVKPTNLTRSIDMSVTNHFDMIIRLPESGPKIACKYVSSPVLLQIPELEGGGVKFDVRYVILLRSIRPLRLFVHKVFWLRFANKPFSLSELDDYETHFTVMNYRPNAFLRQMNCEKFISLYEEQLGQNGERWAIVEQRIFTMLREAFQCATVREPPLGMGSCSSSRALYAADIMLEMNENKIQPKLLEINFTPDCHRACTFYPNFYNQVFNVLFRDTIEEQDVIDISA